MNENEEALEPAIVTYGRQSMGSYKKHEFSTPLVYAFQIQSAEAVLLNSSSHEQKFLAAAVAWGIDEGFLYSEACKDEGQEVVCSFCLTSKGEKEFLRN